MTLQARFDNKIRKHFPGGAHFLAAVSGGADSICLAELLDGSPKVGFSLVHCNFHLRGEESDADEAFVREWAARHGAELHVEHFDTSAYAKSKGISIEMAARELRYRLFSSLCSIHAYNAVITAHNANDNAETLILNLLRGTGLKGLAGMDTISPLPCGSDGQRLFRPMLDFSRDQIEQYLVGKGQGWRTDSSNIDVSYKRNRIRHNIFPEFKAINPSFLETLGEDMQRFAQARDILDSWYMDVRDDFLVREDGQCVVRIPELSAHSKWEYLLYRVLDEHGFNSDSCARIADMVAGGLKSGRVFHARDFSCVTEAERLVIIPADDSEEQSASISAEGTYRFGRKTVKIAASDRIPDKLSIPDGILCDAAKLPFPFELRSWQDGDWMSPLGMKGKKKKLSDMLKDDGIGISRRSALACIARGSHVLAIPETGRIDETIRISPDTRTILIITIS